MSVKNIELILPAWIKLFVELKGKNISTASKNVNIATAHMYNLSKMFQEKDLIVMEKVGRSMLIKYTDKGEELFIICEKMKKFFEENEIKW